MDKETRTTCTRVARPQRGEFCYPANRAPLAPSALVRLPLGSITPGGWLLETLKRQRAGLNGNLGRISSWLQKKDNAWLSPEGTGKWGWEEVPYWLRGYSAMGFILKDEEIIRESAFWIEGVLNSRREDGFFGPERPVKEGGGLDHWGNMVMLFCLRNWYEHSGDQRVIDLMKGYFRFIAETPEEEFLAGYWQKMRGGDLLDSLYWLYNRCGGEELLALAEKIHRCTADWMQEGTLPNWHNVNVAQGFREPAQYGAYSGDPAHRAFAPRNFRLIRERYGRMPGGMWGGDETSRPGYDDPRQAVETCGMAELIFSDGLMLELEGDGFWADNAEDVAYNTLPAAFDEEMKSLRYLTAVNMPASDRENHAPGIDNEGPFFLFSPTSSRCCQHNHGFAWPYFSAYAWAAAGEGGLAALFYGDSTLEARVAGDRTVRIVQESRYPFEESVRMSVYCEEPAAFPLYLRIPRWCGAPAVTLNGRELTPAEEECREGGYLRLERTWREGDRLVLTLPRTLKVRRWEEKENALSVSYGALSFSLEIPEKRQPLDSREVAIYDSSWQEDFDAADWPSLEIFPGGPWNFALDADPDNPAGSLTVQEGEWPADDFPFSPQGTPLRILARGRRLPGWDWDEHKLCGVLPASPAESSEPLSPLSLIPMGAARIRIGSFPQTKES